MKSKTKPLERPPVVRDAYSYIRFSSKKQADGASLERQLTGTRKYCEENNLILNETLTFQDLGVSAFKGDNLDHSLGELLRACADGLIPKGSALVVEALDRLSRQRPRVVSTLLGRLLDDYGLEVHLTGIKKVLYPESESAAEEGMDLLYVTMLAIRASEEQETKAERLNHAFERKRNKVKNGETLLETHDNKLPWWVVYNPETEKLESPPERAETVKQIFAWAAEGVTSPEIARRLDAKDTPTWRPRATRWSPSRIRHMVLSKSAEGVLESTARSKARGHDFKVNEYYPVLVDATLATRARTAMTANSRYGRGNAVPTSDKSERPHNLLRGLLKVEGHPARYDCRKNGTQGNWIGYYYGYDEVARKNLGVVSSKLLEPTVNGRTGSYTADEANQYGERQVHGALDIRGKASIAARVTVNTESTQRLDEYFYKALTIDNSTTPQYPGVSVLAVRNNAGPNGEDIQSETVGNLFLAKNPEAFTHDTEGNLTFDGRWEYTWDGENRLIRQETIATVPAAAKRKLEFSYDAENRRIRKQVFNWSGSAWVLQKDLRCLYDGWNLIAELDAANTILRNFVWGLDLSRTPQGAGGVGGLLAIREGTEGHLPAFDGNGNVMALVKASDQSISSRYEYGPFGETLVVEENGVSNPFRFSTKYLDGETGLYYYGWRYYNPVTGRWSSRDPIEERGGVNLYGFVGNIPTSRIDWLGMIGFDSFKKTIDAACRGQEKKIQHWTVWNDRVRASYDSASDKYLITKEYGILDIEHFLTGANVALKNENFTAKLYIYGGKYTDQDGTIKDYLGRFKRENEKPDVEDLPSDYAGFQFGELIGNGGTPELPIVAKNCTCDAYRSSVIDAITKWQPLSDADHARFMKKYTPVNLPNGINDIAARYEGGRTGWFIRLKLTGNNPDAFNKTVVPYKQVELKTAIESLGAP